jgi:hypothetical protein
MGGGRKGEIGEQMIFARVRFTLRAVTPSKMNNNKNDKKTR